MSYRLPTEIWIDEETCLPIRDKGDFRVVLDCFEILGNTELNQQERLLTCLIVFYEGMETVDDLSSLVDLDKAAKEMNLFFNCGEEYPETEAHKPKLIDWNYDSTLIFSAVNNIAGREVRSDEYLHWWTFMGYYMAVGESSLSTVVGIRSKVAKGKKLEKHEQEFKRENQHYFVWNYKTSTQNENDRLAKELWNSTN